nr:MAG TPA: hypothetical protein [Bacteriophage sp.]
MSTTKPPSCRIPDEYLQSSYVFLTAPSVA